MPYSETLAQSISCSRQPQMRPDYLFYQGYIWSNGVVYNTKYILHNAL